MKHHNEIIDDALASQLLWLKDIEFRASNFRILSTLPYSKVEFWNRVVITATLYDGLADAHPARKIFSLVRRFFKLLCRAKNFDVVLISGGERAEIIYAALASLVPWIKTPHVILDAHWQKDSGLSGLMQRFVLFLSSRLVVQIQPHSAEEIEIYSRLFGVPVSKLKSVPWSSSLIGYDLTRCEGCGNYIVSGGSSFRDYNLLIVAAGELGIRLKLGVQSSSLSEKLRSFAAIYPSVTIHTDWSNADFFREIAGSSVFAMPITQGLTRSTADQSILNAMHMGRLVIASDSIGSRIYINDGVNGFLVSAPTVDEWKSVLNKALSLDEQQFSAISSQAVYDARVNFNEHVHLGRVLDSVLQIFESRA
jgi:glycosyltransferase involved in cell wall biosynthesis